MPSDNTWYIVDEEPNVSGTSQVYLPTDVYNVDAQLYLMGNNGEWIGYDD